MLFSIYDNHGDLEHILNEMGCPILIDEGEIVIVGGDINPLAGRSREMVGGGDAQTGTVIIDIETRGEDVVRGIL